MAQNYQRIQQAYIHDYQKLIYDYYSKDGIPFLVTYYNLNSTETVWDNTQMFGGSYEKVGTLSGIKYNKYSLMPIYFPEEISTLFNGDETGYIKDNETHITFPSSYNIIPYPGDIVKLEQEYLRPTNDIYPIFSVTGMEISTNTDKRFYKVKIMIEQSKSINDIESKVENEYIYFDYTKKFYTPAEKDSLDNLLTKNTELREYLKDLFDDNSGLYFV